MNAPCKDCDQRHPGCHSTCPKYQEFHKENTERLEANIKNRNIEYDYVFARRMQRINKKRRWKQL